MAQDFGGTILENLVKMSPLAQVGKVNNAMGGSPLAMISSLLGGIAGAPASGQNLGQSAGIGLVTPLMQKAAQKELAVRYQAHAQQTPDHVLEAAANQQTGINSGDTSPEQPQAAGLKKPADNQMQGQPQTMQQGYKAPGPLDGIPILQNLFGYTPEYLAAKTGAMQAEPGYKKQVAETVPPTQQEEQANKISLYSGQIKAQQDQLTSLTQDEQNQVTQLGALQKMSWTQMDPFSRAQQIDSVMQNLRSIADTKNSILNNIAELTKQTPKLSQGSSAATAMPKVNAQQKSRYNSARASGASQQEARKVAGF